MNKKLVSMIGAVAVALCAVVGGVIFTGIQTNATGTQITVSAESPTVEKDDEIKVIINASSGEAMSYIKADLTYNSDILELVETSTDVATGANGEIYIIETLAYGETERTYELTFKALEVGATEFYMHDAYIELYESLEMVNVSEDTASVEVVANTSVSEDARIKDVMIAGITDMDKVFNPDVHEYDLEVGVSMEKFFCAIVPMEEQSIVTVPEDLTLDMGQNSFEVIITAPAGNEQIYVFNITRLDHELELETETETESETEAETVIETEVTIEVETEVLSETESAAEETVTETEETVTETEEEVTPVAETLGTELLATTETEVVE